MKSIILSKSLSYIHGVPANNVANKKRMDKILIPAPVTIPLKRKPKDIHPELKVDA
jgi:hypothetical protein